MSKSAAEIGTPFYCYSVAQLRENYRGIRRVPRRPESAHLLRGQSPIPNVAVIRTLADEGAGADVTSIGELERALNAGVKPDKIVFSGVGKRRDEITAALLAGIHQINVESIPELQAISRVATELSRNAPVALRVNPGRRSAYF